MGLFAHRDISDFELPWVPSRHDAPLHHQCCLHSLLDGELAHKRLRVLEAIRVERGVYGRASHDLSHADGNPISEQDARQPVHITGERTNLATQD